MSGDDPLENRFQNRLRSHSISYSVEIGESGLVLGAGTCLARMKGDATHAGGLALAKDAERILALLSIAGNQRSPIDSLRCIKTASDDWGRGDKALANIRLVQAPLPRVVDKDDAYRLFLAEELLDRGTTPRNLLKALGLDEAALDLLKYDPDQPRVPAGSGRNSGQWTSTEAGPDNSEAFKPTVTISEATINPTPRSATTGSTNAAAATVAIAVSAVEQAGETTAAAIFTAAEGSEFLAGLATLGTTIGAGILFGAVFVPSPNSVSTEGKVPGDPDLHYHLDNDTGTLRLTQQSATGSELVASAYRGRDNVFFEADTGIPIARAIGESIVFDAATLTDIAEDDTQTQSRAAATAHALAEADKSPQLCPDPGPDVPHGASARAIAYQAQISFSITQIAAPCPQAWQSVS